MKDLESIFQILEKQAAFAQEQAAHLNSRLEKQIQLSQEQRERLARVEWDLQYVKRHVITIGHAVISEFKGISEEDKALLAENFETALVEANRCRANRKQKEA